MKVRELLIYAENLANENNKEDSAVKLLLMHYLNKESYELIMNMNEEVSIEEETFFKEGVNKYIYDNIPVQHLIGYEYFYGYKFVVGKDVLIPRSETEELVSYVLANYDEYFDKKEVDVVDVGTGSGAIAITLSLEESKMNVDATDISEVALVQAKNNALNLGADVNFYDGDMLDPLIKMNKKYDILVSNPPYIPEAEFVESIVKDNEPHVALFGGNDGMFFYEMILAKAKQILKPKSIIAFEHGWNQREKMELLINKYFPNSKFDIIKDMNGLDRITFIYN